MTLINVKKLSAKWNPFEYQLWKNEFITIEKVTYELSMLKENEEYNNLTSDAHRIAWFVKNGWTDAILLDVGIPGQSSLYVDDGNHRLAAAIYAKNDLIKANIQGSCDEINRYI